MLCKRDKSILIPFYGVRMYVCNNNLNKSLQVSKYNVILTSYLETLIYTY